MSSTLWDLATETLTTSSWKRSWRQEFFTDLGSDFTARIHLEKVTTFGDSPSKHDLLGTLERKASDLVPGTDVCTKATAMQEAITAFVEAVIAEEAAKAAEVVA